MTIQVLHANYEDSADTIVANATTGDDAPSKQVTLQIDDGTRHVSQRQLVAILEKMVYASKRVTGLVNTQDII